MPRGEAVRAAELDTDPTGLVEVDEEAVDGPAFGLFLAERGEEDVVPDVHVIHRPVQREAPRGIPEARFDRGRLHRIERRVVAQREGERAGGLGIGARVLDHGRRAVALPPRGEHRGPRRHRDADAEARVHLAVASDRVGRGVEEVLEGNPDIVVPGADRERGRPRGQVRQEERRDVPQGAPHLGGQRALATELHGVREDVDVHPGDAPVHTPAQIEREVVAEQRSPAVVRGVTEAGVVGDPEDVGVGGLVGVEPLGAVPPEVQRRRRPAGADLLVPLQRALKGPEILVVVGAEVGVRTGAEDRLREGARGLRT